jgi:GTPase
MGMMFRAGYVGLIGLPNSGKSTLLNTLVGEKVAIVTPKPQTTRQRIVGISTTKEYQCCFLDAPGFIRAEKGLNRFLAHEYAEVMKDADVLLAVIAIDEDERENLLEIVEAVSKQRKPWAVAITKTDLPYEHRTRNLQEELAKRNVPVICGSAEKAPKEFSAELMGVLSPLLPESPGALFDPELYTPHSVRDLVVELVREQCFLQLHEEVPFGLAVNLRAFDESSPTLVRIEADLVVSKENHKPMVIGRGAQKLKNIGEAARQQIEKLLQTKVYLGLHVTARTRWMENTTHMKEYGYGIS